MGRWNTEQGLGAKGMIDTRKYEGHTPAPWKPVQLSNRCWTVGNLSVEWQEADKNLIADAPLLLAEVKRLRSGMQDILDEFETTKTDMWSIIKRIQELIE